jgi:hypothetical protein
MLEAVLGLVLVSALTVVPLAWRDRSDRRAARALLLRADIHAAAVRALGGESFLTVQVAPATWWRPGRVLLATPSGWEWLIEEAWSSVMARVPVGYELVVQPAPRRLRPPVAAAPVVARAA